MGKLFFLNLLAFIILFSSFVIASDIAYVVKDTSFPNSNITDIFTNEGYTYDIVYDSSVLFTNFSNYGLIFIEEDINNRGLLPYNNISSLFISNRIANSAWGSNFGQQGGYKEIEVYDNESVIFGNVSWDSLNRTSVYNSLGTIYYLNTKPAYVNNVAIALGASHWNDPVIAVEENGSIRTIFFGLPQINYWTLDTIQMFRNALRFSFSGQDRDGDGFYDDDCNDNNVSINPNASEIAYNYIDEDCDGYDLADVDLDGFCLQSYFIDNVSLQCSNETGNMGTDCNDNNVSINPNASEVIDSIDQNCINDAPVLVSSIPDKIWNEDENKTNTYNLDSYFADPENDTLSYNVSGNTNINIDINVSLVSLYPNTNWNGIESVQFSADDGNLSINSNSVSLEVQAVNDAPVLESISNIYVSEGQLVQIIANASDVDNDTLIYSINDTRFNQTGNNTFEWQTGYNDSGLYVFNVSVSDGNLSDSTLVSISIFGNLYINEFMSDPSIGNDWIEIYNPGSQSVDLDGCLLRDLVNNEKTLSGILNSGSFLAFDWSNRLNNAGDIIYLLCNNLTLDIVAYGSEGNISLPGQDQSAGRLPDGSQNWNLFDWPTKGMSNSEDAEPPKVTLISPANASIYNTGFTNETLLYFNFTASDNSASVLNCTFYSDVNNTQGIFEALASLQIANGSNGSFWAYDILDGAYIWNVQCSDVLNSAFASENYTFTIDAPDAPVLEFVENITINETYSVIVILNASDVDNDTLIYSINDTRFNQTGNNTFEWQTGYNDSGLYVFNVSVSDGNLSDSQDVYVSVINVNRAPVLLNNIPNQTWDEDTNLTIDLSSYFYDFDNDILVYNLGGNISINALFNESLVILYPSMDWNGNESVWFTASDNETTISSNNISLSILPVNDAPTIQNISNISVIEGQLVQIIANASDVDNDTLIYSINDTRFNQTGNNTFEWQTGYNDSGLYVFNVSVSDGNLSDSVLVNVVIGNNQQPVIANYSPDYNPKIAEDAMQNFNITWSDDSQNTTAGWYVNGNLSIGGNSFDFNASEYGVGIYNVTVIVDDGELNSTYEWTLTISDVPISNNYTINNFSSVNESVLANFPGFFIENQYGRIEFLENVDLRDVVDIDRYVRILNSLAALDEDVFSALQNKMARIGMYNVGTGLDVYYTNLFTDVYSEIDQLCSAGICDNINFIGSDLEFEINDFSSFKAGDLATCAEKGGQVCGAGYYCEGSLIDCIDSTNCCSGSCIEQPPTFSDVDTCKNTSDLIDVEIKNPDAGDDFKINDEIEIRVKVKNNDEDDKSYDVEAYLYDLTEDEQIESVDGNLDVNKDDSETLEMTIKVPDNIERNNEFAIYVRVEDDFCNENYVKIDLKREKYDVVVKEFEIEPATLGCGQTAEVNMKVENLGYKDVDDAYIELSIPEIDYKEKSNIFKLGEYDGKNIEEVNFFIQIPDDVGEGVYDIDAKVYFDGDYITDKQTFSVSECSITGEYIYNSDPITISENNVEIVRKLRWDNLTEEELIMLMLVLLIGIVSLMIVIIIVRDKILKSRRFTPD